MPSSDLILGCSCSQLSHSVRFSVFDDGEAYIHVALDYERSFWGRLKVAWRYLFRSVCAYNDASEVMLYPADYPKLRSWLDKAEAIETARLAVHAERLKTEMLKPAI